jgi:hypothetical protein
MSIAKAVFKMRATDSQTIPEEMGDTFKTWEILLFLVLILQGVPGEKTPD